MIGLDTHVEAKFRLPSSYGVRAPDSQDFLRMVHFIWKVQSKNVSTSLFRHFSQNDVKLILPKFFWFEQVSLPGLGKKSTLSFCQEVGIYLRTRCV